LYGQRPLLRNGNYFNFMAVLVKNIGKCNQYTLGTAGMQAVNNMYYA
jgi:hypothetical protein